MTQNNLIEDIPENMLFLKRQKIYQINDTIAPFYDDQIHKIGTAKIVILVDKSELNSENANNADLLAKMRKALNSIGGESHVIELEQGLSLDWVALKSRLKVRKFILFGLDFSSINIQANSFKNSIIPFDLSYFLISDKLSLFHESADLKNLIWKKMRSLVEI